MGSAREAAMLTLTACERQGAWSDGYLKKVLREQKLDRREAALAAHLSYGVLQNKLLLDWHLEAFSKSPLDKLDVRVLCNLRVALYQLLFLDKIPCSAAVNEAVELTKKHCRNPRAAGMVNGILRSVLRQEKLSAPDFPDKEKACQSSTAIRLGWLGGLLQSWGRTVRRRFWQPTMSSRPLRPKSIRYTQISQSCGWNCSKLV